MKQNLLTSAIVVAIAAVIIGGFVVAAVAGFTAGEKQGAAMASSRHWSCDQRILEQLPSTLSITVDQLDNVRRITDRARPQLAAVRNDARQKKQAIMDQAMSEIAVLLTPKQQQKLNELQQARRAEHHAKEQVREALKPSSLFESQ